MITQVAAKVAVTEEVTLVTPQGEKHQTIQHDPCWIFTMQSPSKHTVNGGWRVSARLRDRFAPSGVGSEVEQQIPPDAMTKQLEQMWALQKTAAKAEKYTIAGAMANVFLT